MSPKKAVVFLAEGAEDMEFSISGKEERRSFVKKQKYLMCIQWTSYVVLKLKLLLLVLISVVIMQLVLEALK